MFFPGLNVPGLRVDDGGSMYCDGCGAPVEAGQGFCSRCGKQFVGPATALQSSTGRVQRHVHLLGILWLAFSALNAIGGVVLYIIANTLFAPGGGTGAPAFLHPLLSVVGILVLGKAALGFIAGWGLLQREPWARTVALVLAFISLFNIPFGTAVGVYTMWVLLPSQAEQEYETMVAARAAEGAGINLRQCGARVRTPPFDYALSNRPVDPDPAALTATQRSYPVRGRSFLPRWP